MPPQPVRKQQRPSGNHPTRRSQIVPSVRQRRRHRNRISQLDHTRQLGARICQIGLLDRRRPAFLQHLCQISTRVSQLGRAFVNRVQQRLVGDHVAIAARQRYHRRWRRTFREKHVTNLQIVSRLSRPIPSEPCCSSSQQRSSRIS